MAVTVPWGQLLPVVTRLLHVPLVFPRSRCWRAVALQTLAAEAQGQALGEATVPTDLPLGSLSCPLG